MNTEAIISLPVIAVEVAILILLAYRRWPSFAWAELAGGAGVGLVAGGLLVLALEAGARR